IFCVMVPAVAKLDRFCGIRNVFASSTTWLGKGIFVGTAGGVTIVNGVMSTVGMVGGPLLVVEVPWATTVVPCGIDAIRASETPSDGVPVGGTIIQRPGSRWMPVGWAGLVTSLIDCKTGTPF